MKKRVLFLILFLCFNLNAFGQYVNEEISPNFGLSINILGPIFGVYSLGVSTFITSRIQLGVSGTYYSTRDIEPQAEGWVVEYRMTYYFSPMYKNGFYLGLAGGFESIQVRDSSGAWNTYEDPIGGIIPGYHWALTRALSMMAGLNFGYQFGAFQITPEINFIYFF